MHMLHNPAHCRPLRPPAVQHTIRCKPLQAKANKPDWATSPQEAEHAQEEDRVFVSRNSAVSDAFSPFDASTSSQEWRTDLQQLTAAVRSNQPQLAQRASDAQASQPSNELPASNIGLTYDGFPRERAYLVGVASKSGGPGRRGNNEYSVQESLDELGRLANTAGLEVVGTTYQHLDSASPRTYIGTGKLNEVAASITRLSAETVIFDDELSAGQLRNLSKVLGDNVRLCDRTALILDIFSQRAATREGQLQVELAQHEYQLPRLTRMWTHLERQSGSGQVKGMGEKQIEVDKRILRSRMAAIKQDLDSVRMHRKQYRVRRSEAPIPVVALVGYTNAGKSTLLNQLTQAEVLAEDKLFATLDPTTRRLELPTGKEVLFTDTVGFIQKLPTQLVAAFRATLEEIADASLLLHVVDVSHSNAAAQTEAVHKVLEELGVGHVPSIYVWNKVDACKDPALVAAVAAARPNTVCCSGLTGEGIPALLQAVSDALEEQMIPVEVVVPYNNGELVDEIHRLGIVKWEDFNEQGTCIAAYVPECLANKLEPMLVQAEEQFEEANAA